MPGKAGYLTKVRLGGTTTVMTSENMTEAADGTTVAFRFRIVDTAKEVWSRNAAFTFTANGTTIPSAEIVKIDYLFGRITFLSTTQAAPVRVAGSYIPLAELGGTNTYNLNQVMDVLDNTDFSNDGNRSKQMGLQDVSLTLSRFQPVTGGNALFDAQAARTPVFAEIHPGGVGPRARGWFFVEDDSRGGAVADLEGEDISLVVDADNLASFGWEDQIATPTTT